MKANEWRLVGACCIACLVAGVLSSLPRTQAGAGACAALAVVLALEWHGRRR